MVSAIGASSDDARKPLNVDLVDILEAVRDALALPYPATVGDTDTYRRILDARAMHVRVFLDFALRDLGRQRDILGDDFAVEMITSGLAHLRARTAETPAIGYKTSEQAKAEREGGAS